MIICQCCGKPFKRENYRLRKYCSQNCYQFIVWIKRHPKNIEEKREYFRETLLEWRKNNPKKVKEYQQKYRIKHLEILKNRIRNWYNKTKFGGIRYKILERDNYQCQICGQKGKLHIHHWDGKKENNTYWNLLTLCCGCHRLTHLKKI